MAESVPLRKGLEIDVRGIDAGTAHDALLRIGSRYGFPLYAFLPDFDERRRIGIRQGEPYAYGFLFVPDKMAEEISGLGMPIRVDEDPSLGIGGFICPY